MGQISVQKELVFQVEPELDLLEVRPALNVDPD